MAHYSADELFQVFIKWINLFDFVDNPIKYVFEISDGVILFKLLNKLSPKYFQLNSINLSPSNKYSLNNNIIELKQCLEQFFNDVIDQDIAVDLMIDHKKITFYNSSSSLSSFYNDNITVQHYVRLIEMILLCSIKCENKHITINLMTSLSINDQRMLMNILQILMKNTGFDIPNKDENKNENKNKNKSIKPPKTPISESNSFRRLSIAKYSNQSHNNSFLSPFGSKTKTKTNIMSPIHFNYNMDQKDNNYNLRLQELESLKKENKEILRKYIELKDELSSNQNDFKKRYKQKEKDLNIEIERNQEEIKKIGEEIRLKDAEIRFKDEEINEYKILIEKENNKYSQKLQEINDLNNIKLRELRDELDIARHKNGLSFQFEKQIKQYQLRLESMNNIENELNKYKSLYSSKCDYIKELNQKLKIIPNLKQQIEKYKKLYISVSVGCTESKLNDTEIRNKLQFLQENIIKLNQENDELRLNLTNSRKEVINLQTELQQTNDDNLSNEIESDLHSKISNLQSENRRLKSMINTKHTMNDLMDELDTKTKLLKTLQLKYKEQINNMEITTTKYQNTLKQLNEKNKYIDSLKINIDKLRENKISSTAKLAEYKGEINRTKQRYRDLYDYTEKQKLRLNQYKKAMSEIQSFESNEKQKSFQSEKYFQENQQLKERIMIISQEMKCVQNAFMNLLKRQVLINNNMLSNNRSSSSSSFNSFLNIKESES